MLDLVEILAGIATIAATLTTFAYTVYRALGRGRRDPTGGPLAPRGHIPPLAPGAFVNRDEAVCQLRAAAGRPHTRMVALVGGGGIGKTALAIRFARAAEGAVPQRGRLLRRLGRRPSPAVFEKVVWATTRLRPVGLDFLGDVILAMAPSHIPLAQTLTRRVDQLVGLLRAERHLLVIDNAETVLATTSATDRATHEEYQYIFRAIAESEHRSVVLITSRTPIPVHPRLYDSGHCVEIPLHEMSPDAARRLFDIRLAQLHEAGQQLDPPPEGVGPPGNPLFVELAALQCVSRDDGHTTRFPPSGTADDFRDVVQWHMKHLSAMTRRIALQVALAVDGVSGERVRELLGGDVTEARAARAVTDLRFTLGLRQGEDGRYHFHQVVAELLGQWLVSACARELRRGEFDVLRWVLLCCAWDSRNQRDATRRRVVVPLLDLLAEEGGSVTAPLVAALDLARGRGRGPERGAAAHHGPHLVGLLAARGQRLTGLDLSAMTYRFVDFTEVELHRCDLSGALFVDCRFVVPHGGVLDLTWSADDSRIVGVDALGNALTWRATDFAGPVARRVSHNWLRAAGTLADDLAVVGGDDSELILIDTVRDTVLDRRRAEGMFWIRAIGTTPGGRALFAGGEDGAVRRWSIAGGRLTLDGTWPTRARSIRAITAIDEHQAVVACSNGSFAVVGPGADDIRHIEVGGSDQARCVGVNSSTGLVAVASNDVLWIGDTSGSRVAERSANAPIRALTWTADGMGVLTSGEDGVIWHWRVTADDELSVAEPTGVAVLRERVTAMRLAHGGSKLATSCEGEKTYLVDISTGEVNALSNGSTRRTWSIGAAPDGSQVVTAGEDRLARVWRVTRGSARLAETGSLQHGGRVWRSCFSLCGNHIVTASDDGVVRVWNAGNLRIEAELTGHTDWVLEASTLVRDGREYILSGSNDRRIGVWTLDGDHVTWHTHHEARVLRVRRWRDGLAVSTSSDETVVVFDPLDPSREVTRISCPGHRAWGLDTHPDGEEFATTGDDGRIIVWGRRGDTFAPEVIDTMPDMVLGAYYCQGGSLLVVGSLIEDGMRAYRRVPGGGWQRVTDLDGADRIRTFCSIADGSVLLAAGADDEIRAYSIPELRHLGTTPLPAFYEGSSFAGARQLTAGQRSAITTLGAVGASN
ncbi:hypothetical protein ACFV2X_14970 [Streptomyces sp. NPDC059679]|uniref:hypothetical protein n=1 Tax=Streptomyces sp. NPDC059679 TaxID=3346903 RepID=UPI003682E401